jgi:hypothetical protein
MLILRQEINQKKVALYDRKRWHYMTGVGTQINNLVYSYYELSDLEIKNIQNSIKDF